MLEITKLPWGKGSEWEGKGLVFGGINNVLALNLSADYMVCVLL